LKDEEKPKPDIVWCFWDGRIVKEMGSGGSVVFCAVIRVIVERSKRRVGRSIFFFFKESSKKTRTNERENLTNSIQACVSRDKLKGKVEIIYQRENISKYIGTLCFFPGMNTPRTKLILIQAMLKQCKSNKTQRINRITTWER
jgi:hypothetical protein